MNFKSDTIGYIHGLSKKFTEEHLSEEVIFFDGIWEIYESQLKKWIKKPSKKWKFKPPQRKLTKILAASGSGKFLDLDTYKVITILVNTLAQVSISTLFSLDKIKETMKCLGEEFELPSTLKYQIVDFFAPILLKDLQKRELIPVSENEAKREYVIYSHLGRKELTEEEYLQKKEKFEGTKKQCFLFINEITDEFYVYGEDQIVSDHPKELLKLLIKNAGCTLDYQTIYEGVTEIKLDEIPADKESDSTLLAYKWFSLLKVNVDKRLTRCLKTVRGKGYKICMGKKSQFYFFDYLI